MKHRILIVEDNAAIADNLRELLEGDGYEVSTASNGLQGLMEIDGERRPSVIVLDLMLPDMDGLKFREEQKARPPDVAEIPVLGWSAYDHLRPDFEVLPKSMDGQRRLLERIHELSGGPRPPKKRRTVTTRRLGFIATIAAAGVALAKVILDHVFPPKGPTP